MSSLELGETALSVDGCVAAVGLEGNEPTRRVTRHNEANITTIDR